MKMEFFAYKDCFYSYIHGENNSTTEKKKKDKIYNIIKVWSCSWMIGVQITKNKKITQITTTITK